MKKVFENRILLVLLTSIICTCGTLLAANLFDADDISYINDEMSVNNVKEAIDDLYDKSNNDKIKEQTVTQEITMAAVYKGFYTFTFDELEEVKGVSIITKDYVGDGNNSGKYQHLVPVEGTGVGTADSYTTHYNRGPYYKIEGNTVVIRLYNGVGSYTTTATWSITAVGI